VRQSSVSTRIASDPQRVERAVDLMYRCRERVARNRSYDDLLASRHDTHGKLDPRVFISLGSAQLWSGMRPRFFRRLLQRGDLRFNFRTLSALVWAAWASLEPHTLRAFMRLLLVARNAKSDSEVRTNEPVLWRGGTLLTLSSE
jgi:hypothetical protein